MSLIIEDKTSLDSLANAIIGANGSVDKTSATKGELTDIINGIIPLKSKFASGVFTPSENITTQNSPRINFALGNDENGMPIKPNLIICYQPYAMTDAEIAGVSFLSAYVYGTPIANPVLYPQYNCWKFTYYRKTSTTTDYYTASIQKADIVTDNVSDDRLFDKRGFKLCPARDEYPYTAGHPIVWLQIKF